MTSKVVVSSDGNLAGHAQVAGVKTEAAFKEKHGEWDPMMELTITHLIS